MELWCGGRDGEGVSGADWRAEMSTISVRLPESLHKKARELAKREGVSINQLVATALAEKVSALLTEAWDTNEMVRWDITSLLALLSKQAYEDTKRRHDVPGPISRGERDAQPRSVEIPSMLSNALNRISSDRTHSAMSGSTTRQRRPVKRSRTTSDQPGTTDSTSRKLYGLLEAAMMHACS
jgi:hypothetical protein